MDPWDGLFPPSPLWSLSGRGPLCSRLLPACPPPAPLFWAFSSWEGPTRSLFVPVYDGLAICSFFLSFVPERVFFFFYPPLLFPDALRMVLCGVSLLAQTLGFFFYFVFG